MEQHTAASAAGRADVGGRFAILLRMRLWPGLAVFAVAYLILNQKFLVARILYRWAAGDRHNAVINLLSSGAQAGLLLMIVLLLPWPALAVVLVAVFISGLVNVTHAQMLGAGVDQGSMAWMLSEVRQLIPAVLEFWPDFLLASGKVIVAVGLLLVARRLLVPCLPARGLAVACRPAAWMALLALFVLADPLIPGIKGRRAAEMNAYVLAAASFMQTYPERKSVAVTPVAPVQVTKIVWLVDESISYRHFHQVMPGIAGKWQAIDYGEAYSLGNCSAQSNALMRWGVNTEANITEAGLQANPAIWAYALKAGYKTVLIDGQVSAAPQNLVWPPERRMIQDFRPAMTDLTTDRKVAGQVNALLKRDGKYFVYVTFKGAHYQYHSNYPEGELPAGSPVEARYRKAIEYSKRGVFEALFDGVDRNQVAVFYTADHGQILRDGVIPHCNTVSYPEEFSVPLLAFLPESLRQNWAPSRPAAQRHSQSQLFPSSLILMGYDPAYAQAYYDRPLPASPKRTLTFSKSFVPREEGTAITAP